MNPSHQAILYALGQNIRRIRKNQGMRQMGLEALTGINHSDISRIENGQKNVELVTVIKIAEALEVDIKDLF
ncbi:MAG TPA: helix-turn-helix transcriptional regulator [Flavitalea sp.]|nr:helix-turn-helix transcriptional regulator [Flavitalea sp.]